MYSGLSGLGGVYTHQQLGPDHQVSLTQITNHQKKKKGIITKILMFYKSVGSPFHAVPIGHVENVSCARYIASHIN